MPCLNDPMFMVRLPSGNRAVYEITPNHLNDLPGTTLSERCRMYGRQIAHEQHDGNWYRPGSWEQITDIKTIALIERVPEA